MFKTSERSKYWSFVFLLILLSAMVYLVARDGNGGDNAPVPTPNFRDINDEAP